MRSPERVRARIEAIEEQARGPARDAAAALWRPPDERFELPAAAAELRRLQTAAAVELTELRRLAIRTERTARTEELNEFIRAVRTRVQYWARINDAVDDCAAGHEWPLVPARRPKLDLGAVQESVLTKVFTDAHAAANRTQQKAEAAALGCFPDIALGVGHFVQSAHLACRLLMARRQRRPFSFLDVGCGGGMKVALAAEFFDRAEGLDYDQGYVEVATANFYAMRAGRCRAFHADGITFDGYADYDVIYFYRPMQDDDGLMALERQICAQCRPGTILIASYPGFQSRFGALGCQHVAADVYLRDADEAASVALSEAARRIGPHVLLHGKGVPRGTGWLKHLWLACLANGIRPES